LRDGLFSDTTALITGASSGIGAAMAGWLAPTGARLILVGRDTTRLTAVAMSARGLGAAVETLPLDLTAPGGVAALCRDMEQRGVVVDHLINNAGAGIQGHAVGIPVEAQLRVLDLNARAATELALRLLPGMVGRRRGGVLNVSSLAAFQGMPNLSVYAGTKAYLLSWSEALHIELRGTGVRCCCLCPGPVDTRFFAAAHMRKPPAIFSIHSPQAVARTGLRAYARNVSHCVPGAVPAMAAWLTRFAPRRLNALMAARFARPEEGA
jgi:short-subunit dehydrogenase